MRMISKLKLALVLIAAPACAQTTSTTCMINGQWVNCTSRTQRGVDTMPTNFLNAIGPLPNAYEQQQQVLRDQQEHQIRQQQIEIQRLQLALLRAQQAAQFQRPQQPVEVPAAPDRGEAPDRYKPAPEPCHVEIERAARKSAQAAREAADNCDR